MKATRDGGHVDVSEWCTPVFEEASQAFNGALSQIIRNGVNQILECALPEEGVIVFHDNGTFSLHTPLSNAELTVEPVFKFDLVGSVAEEVSFLEQGDEDQIDNLKSLRATLLKAVALLDKALD